MAHIITVFFKYPFYLLRGHSESVVRNTKYQVLSFAHRTDMDVAFLPVRGLCNAVHNGIFHKRLQNNINTGQLLHAFLRFDFQMDGIIEMIIFNPHVGPDMVQFFLHPHDLSALIQADPVKPSQVTGDLHNFQRIVIHGLPVDQIQGVV